MSVDIKHVGIPGSTTVKALSEQCKKNEDGDVLANFTELVNFEPQEIPIRANKVFVYEFDFAAPASKYLDGTMCWVKSAFMPEPGKRYRAHFSLSNNSCRILLTETGLEGSSVPVKTFTPSCR